jgi:DNA-binding beta-propeller fold protein YncE
MSATRPAWIVLLLLGGFAAAVAAQSPPAPPAIPVPGGEGGVGFDDLRFSPRLDRVIVPAGRTGSILLVEPGQWRIDRITGFSTQARPGGGRGVGVTSADEGRGFLFAADRSAKRLLVVDPSTGRTVGGTNLAGGPDYVRYVEPTGEVWVTEPENDRIEIFRLEGNPPAPRHDDFLAVEGGPESLVVDGPRGVAYVNLWKGETLAIRPRNRSVLAKWSNGCSGSRGLALDAERDYLFVGCAEGRGVTLDPKTGRVLGSVRSGDGVDIIDYSPALSHLYLPGGRSATMAIVEVSGTGELSLLGTVPTAQRAHCVVADRSGNAYVCDPGAGRILVIPDPFGSSPR